MIKLLFFWTLLGCLCAPALGQETILFNLGTHTEFYNKIQDDSSGGTRKFDFAPTLGAGIKLPLIDHWHFLPEFNWVLPQNAGSDRIIKNTFMLRADFGYDLMDWFRLRAGTSLIWLNQHGRGGSAEINNGNSTSTFYYPDENRSSLNNTLDFGAEVLMQDWALRLQTYVYSVFLAEKRQTSYTLFISYYWDR
ncbi:MAG: hypothetical protein NDI69_07220 [Bacteriovoracaceae bacterium]|nr:hypothetical protein [Bacteriovoracaceae bacterium]